MNPICIHIHSGRKICYTKFSIIVKTRKGGIQLFNFIVIIESCKNMLISYPQCSD